MFRTFVAIVLSIPIVLIAGALLYAAMILGWIFLIIGGILIVALIIRVGLEKVASSEKEKGPD